MTTMRGQMFLWFCFSTKEYNERLLQIQQTLSEIKNGAAREHLQGKGWISIVLYYQYSSLWLTRFYDESLPSQSRLCEVREIVSRIF